MYFGAWMVLEKHNSALLASDFMSMMMVSSEREAELIEIVHSTDNLSVAQKIQNLTSELILEKQGYYQS